MGSRISISPVHITRLRVGTAIVHPMTLMNHNIWYLLVVSLIVLRLDPGADKGNASSGLQYPP